VPNGRRTRSTYAHEVSVAMREIDRRRFLPRNQRPYAGDDRPLPIGHGQTNSQPRTVADTLLLLRVPHGARVLDVGSGSGWTTALLAHLVGPSGSVVGVEIDPDLAAWGAANLATYPMSWARIETAEPDVLGRPTMGGYDRILVSAAAQVLPQQLVDQLAVGGRLVIPVQHALVLVEQHLTGAVTSRHGSYSFVPLIGS
jgi:protein-L-isoaspartate(D-aspartate) O-methyltransferase